MEAVKIKCFLVCQMVFDWPSWARQTDQCKHWTSLGLDSFSCRPADAPHPHVLMAFYGSLESLWLLLTQWDSLQRQRGLQREGQPQYIADAKSLKHKKRRLCLASEAILAFESLDLIWNVLLFVMIWLVLWIIFLLYFEQSLFGVFARSGTIFL